MFFRAGDVPNLGSKDLEHSKRGMHGSLQTWRPRYLGSTIPMGL